MAKYFKIDEWSVVEEGLNLENNMVSESIMSLGNGHMGIRGNFEEKFSGPGFQGTYIAGVYYPDKTRVGWWKVGYPEYYAKVLNAASFIGIYLKLNNKEIDLARTRIENYKRVLNMKHGYLKRTFTIIDDKDRRTKVDVMRFLSIADPEIAVISYSITPLGHNAKVELIPLLDGRIRNQDANYDEIFWEELERSVEKYKGFLNMKTRKSNFQVATAMKYNLTQDPEKISTNEREKYIDNRVVLTAEADQKLTLYKYAAVTTNRDYEDDEIVEEARRLVKYASDKRFDNLLTEHAEAWERHWKESDIIINGDPSAQQGIRFNIFHLNQTYTGEDPRLNIGPKGFTGEKYGGSTYWDTEAFCLPFYLSTAEERISRNLLLYRYNHLEKARENAAKLGLKGALYPMVTMNGEESHNEWEITFEEIHRNAAIAYAIYNYVNYTGDKEYLADYGFEVIAEIARFWADRVNYNPRKDKYMILGVTGPNEYENNVNNNWYTNRMAAWTLEYALEVRHFLTDNYPERYIELNQSLDLEGGEFDLWQDIIDKMYYPVIDSSGVFEQQDGYMDKEQLTTAGLSEEDLPLHQNWSWDRILRSCFIKQADVLQGLFFLNDRYDLETKRNNFDFYEPKTVHESSLSPCIYSIIAAEIGYEIKAYQLYLRTARLDLENYNNDTEDGLHITSMAGTWMSIVYGFAGMRVRNNQLNFRPFIPEKWTNYSFKLLFRGNLIKVHVYQDKVVVKLEEGETFKIIIDKKEFLLPAEGYLEVEL